MGAPSALCAPAGEATGIPSLHSRIESLCAFVGDLLSVF
jgi:hypothetical protein